MRLRVERGVKAEHRARAAQVVARELELARRVHGLHEQLGARAARNLGQPQVEVGALAHLEEERARAALHVARLVDDAAVALGVELGVLLAVRQQREQVSQQVPVPCIFFCRFRNAVGGGGGASATHTLPPLLAHLKVTPRDDSSSTFSLFLKGLTASPLGAVAAAAGAGSAAAIVFACFFACLPPAASALRLATMSEGGAVLERLSFGSTAC